MSLGRGLILFAFVAASASALEPRRLRLGVIPSIAKERTVSELQPVVSYLSDEVKHPIDLVVAKDYGDISTMLAGGQLDFAILFPLAYVQASASVPGLTLLACSVRQGKAAYRGYVVTRQDSAVHRLEDLRGKKIAFVDKNSTSGYLFPLQLFIQEKLIASEADLPRFFSAVEFRKSHDNVLQAVVAGEVEAGAVYDGELVQAARIGVDSGALRILARTDPIPHEAVVATRSSQDVADAVKHALLELDTRSARGRSILRPLVTELKLNGFVECDPHDFDVIRDRLKANP